MNNSSKDQMAASDLDDRSGDSDYVDPFEHIKTLEDIEASFPSKSPRSERRKLSLRARLKSLTTEKGDDHRDRSINSSTHKSSDGELPPPPPSPYYDQEQQQQLEGPAPRVRRAGKKKDKHSRTSNEEMMTEDEQESPMTYDEMVKKHKKSERRESMGSTKSGGSSRRRKKDKKRRSSVGRSATAKEKAKAARAARAKARKYSQPPEEDDSIRTTGRSIDFDYGTSTEMILNHADAAVAAGETGRKPEKGYESDGVLGGGAKRRAQRARHAAKNRFRRSPTSPEEERRQAIMDDLDTFDDRESVTTMYLKQQIETLKQKVESLTSEKQSMKEQLEEEFQKNQELVFKLSEQRLTTPHHHHPHARITATNSDIMSVGTNGSASGGDGTTTKLEAVHKEEKLRWEKQLKEKDICIDKLQASINHILVSKDASPLIMDHGEREHLTQTNAKVSMLEETIEIQKSQIDDLTVKLSELSTASMVDSKMAVHLQDELKHAKADKVALNRDLEKAKLEYEASMARKDETVTFFQQELTKLKATTKKAEDGVPDPSSAGRRRRTLKAPGAPRDQSPGRLSFLVSPFAGRKEVKVGPPPEGEQEQTGGLPSAPL